MEDSVNEIKRILNDRIHLEVAKNLQYVVQQISNIFNEAIDCENKEIIITLYKKIKTHSNYLTEKYRETKEERLYIEALEQAKEFLRQKI